MVKTSQKFGFPMVPTIGKQQNGGYLVFGPLENRTSMCLVFQYVWYSNVQYYPATVFLTTFYGLYFIHQLHYPFHKNPTWSRDRHRIETLSS